MTVNRHRLEATVADAAILHPELAGVLGEIVAGADFVDPYLSDVFAAALVAADETPDLAAADPYRATHEVLVRYGRHHEDRDVCRLYALRGGRYDVAGAARALAELARRDRLSAAIVSAHGSLCTGADTDGVAARLRGRIDGEAA